MTPSALVFDLAEVIMSVAGGESGSRDQDDELADLIDLVDVLVKALGERMRANENDDIRGSTRIYLVAVVLPEVQRVLDQCPESLPVRVARNYVHARRAAEDLAALGVEDLAKLGAVHLAKLGTEEVGELGADDLGKPNTELKTKDELTPLQGVLTALRREHSRRHGRSPSRPEDQKSGGASHRWTSPPTDPGRPKHRSIIQEDRIFIG